MAEVPERFGAEARMNRRDRPSDKNHMHPLMMILEAMREDRRKPLYSVMMTTRKSLDALEVGKQ